LLCFWLLALDRKESEKEIMLEMGRFVIQGIPYAARYRETCGTFHHCWKSRIGTLRQFAAPRHSAGAGTNNLCTLAYALFVLFDPSIVLRNNSIYASALLETDWLKIEGHIQVSENAIRVRLHEFSMNHGGTPEENQAIQDALRGLDILRKEVAAWRERAI
jgi:hypothetical protein